MLAPRTTIPGTKENKLEGTKISPTQVTTSNISEPLKHQKLRGTLDKEERIQH
jgi:hypothetical protein